MEQANLGGTLPCATPHDRAAPVLDFVVSFLSSLFEQWTTPSPDVPHVRVLAHSFSMQLVHELAEDEFEIYPFVEGFHPAHPPSIPTIRRVWNTYFPHVVQPNMSEFGSCGRCHELLARLKAARGRDEE